MTRRKRSRTPERPSGHPSLFFIIAILIALAFLAWGASRIITTPVEPPAASSGAKP